MFSVNVSEIGSVNVMTSQKGGLTNEQIADSLGQPLSSICARINELKKIDLVIDSGKRTKSKYNKDVILWQRKDQLKSREI